MVLKGAGFDRVVWQKGLLKRNKCREVAQETRGWPLLCLGQRTAEGVSWNKSPGPDHEKLEGQARQLGSPQCVQTDNVSGFEDCLLSDPPEEKTTTQKPLTQLLGGDPTTLSGSRLPPPSTHQAC